MSVEEVARATRVPMSSIERIEADLFDELPGEVFVRGFLKAYARALGLSAEEVLALYTQGRRVAWVTPVPINTATRSARRGSGIGVFVAVVLLLILFTVAISVVLRPRGDDMPQELSQGSAASQWPSRS